MSNNRKEAEALALPPMGRFMQTFSMVLFFLLGVVVTVLLVANPFGLRFLPGSAGQADPDGHTAAHMKPGTLYQCPMHPEVLEAQPGQCPICKMDLMPVESAIDDGSAVTLGANGEREILHWYAPMDPTYVRDEPGLSPMGMNLVPKYADDSTKNEASVVRIDPVQVQNIGVVSEKVRVEDIGRSSRTVGILDFNADEITWVNTKFEGWIEKVYVNYVGQDVKQGQPLFEIYSPELVTTQEEYVRALGYRASLESSKREQTLKQADSLVASTRDRLVYWDISEEQIEELERTRSVQRRITILSPANGVVAEIMEEALEGMYIRPGMNLYKIADLSTVWVHAAVYESDMPWIRKEQPAVVTFRHEADRVFRGEVLFLYPEVSRETRTLKICVEVPNPNGRLRPGMYADVVVHGPPVTDAIVVPQSAVIRSGERNIVFVDLGDGRFRPAEVKLGITGTGDRIQVIEGVVPGEAVVTQAQFMLDSESRIQEAIAKFVRPGKGRP